ncbi:hypothetical protein [Halogeometricum luteum]|uniref:Uncharacterized protein n=1 Tax=Halogeometricum luteum TaxID=2950537 RepID=A0ABU2G341_9EURY|nr:hypothetical protein [Halogeometricum sp. S3BR5-2]MDS0294718.1 hypothetical protein [Halogeometricum sp. S3BR5-2]
MGDKSFTLFEINLHEPSFSASNSAPGIIRNLAEEATEADEDGDGDGLFQSIDVVGGDAEDALDEGADADVEDDLDGELDDVETDDDSGSSGRGKGSTIMGLLLLAALAVAKKVLSGDDVDELADLDDLTDISVDDAGDAVDAVEEAEDAVDVEDDADADDVEDDGSSSGRSKSSILVALVLLGALIVARKLMSGDDELAELDDLSETDDDGHDAALDTDANDEAATNIVDEETDADEDEGDHDAALDEDEEDEE